MREGVTINKKVSYVKAIGFDLPLLSAVDYFLLDCKVEI